MIEVAKAFYNASDKIDLNKLFKYATAMKNKSMCSRLGYLQESK
jgi:predicted transcriptional regulator of viral defense system